MTSLLFLFNLKLSDHHLKTTRKVILFKRSFFTILLICIILSPLFSIEVTDYYKEELSFNAQVWAVTEDNLGLIYAAFNNGVQIYDGVEWRNHRIPNITVRSIAHHQGTVYVGGRAEFGYFDKKFKYFSLTQLLEKKDHKFGNVYRVLSTPYGVFFRSSEKLFHLNKNRITTFSKPYYRDLHLIDNDIYLVKTNGLYKFSKNQFQLLPNSSIFKKKRVAYLYKSDEFLKGVTRKHGTIKWHENFATIDPDKSEIKEVPYRAENLKNGVIGLATLRNGFYLYRDGKKKLHITKKDGIKDNDCKSLFQDKNSNLWVSLNNGIQKINLTPQFKQIFKGIKVLTLGKHKSEILIGTTKGLHIFNKEDCSLKSTEFKRNCWAINNFANKLIFSHLTKIIVDKSDIISVGEKVFRFKKSKNNKRLWVSTDLSFHSFTSNSNGKIVLEKSFKTIEAPIKSIVEENRQTLWLSTQSKGVLLIKFKLKNDDIDITKPIIKSYYTNKGLPRGEIFAYKIKDTPIFTTRRGIYRYDRVSDSFVPFRAFGNEFCNGLKPVFRLKDDDKGNVWIVSKRRIYKAIPTGSGKYKIISKDFIAFPKVQVNAILPDGDYIWFGTNEGLYRFDTRVKVNMDEEFNTLITGMFNDHKEFFKAYTRDNMKEMEVEWKDNDFSFTFASPYFRYENKTFYQYRLVGYKKGRWSEWNRKFQKSYMNLLPGSYIFEARGKNVYDKVGKTARFRFRILPPWYLSWWALAGYGFILIFLILILLKLSAYILRSRQN